MIDTLVRAFRGTVRSPARTLLVVLLLAVGLAFALTSLALAFAADDQVNEIKETTGTDASVRIHPDQFSQAIQRELTESTAENRTFDSTRVGLHITPLTTADVDAVAALPYVHQVESLTIAAPEYGIPGREPRGENDFSFGNTRFSLPDAILTGTRDASFLVDFIPGTGTKELKEGRLFTADDAGKSVVVIDQDTATLEELQLGDTIVLTSTIPPPEGSEGEPQVLQAEAEIIGIYRDLAAATQGGFSPATIQAWYAPIDLVRQLQPEDGRDTVSAISLLLNSVDDSARFREDAKQRLDVRKFAITTTEERFEEISDPVETMRRTSVVGTAAGLAVVSLIMVLLMALVVRGRLREIGILKAVGARNRQVILQFAMETIGIAVVAVAVAIPLTLASNPIVADAFRGSPDVKEQRQDGLNQGGPDLGSGARALTDAPIVDDPVSKQEVEAVLNDVDASVDAQIIVLAAVIAVGLGLLGALVPIVAVLRLRPAEVLRLEA